MKKARINKRKKITREIIIGIVVTIICDVLHRLFINVPQTGKTIIVTIQNLIYSSAAQTSSNTLLIMIFEMFLGFVFAFSITHFVSTIMNHRFNKRAENLHSEINNLCSKIEEEPNNIDKYKDEIDNSSKNLDVLETELNIRKTKTRQTNKIFSVLLPILVTIYVLFTFISIIYPLLLLDVFSRDIQMIKPYTDSNTIELIESDWTRMKSKNDYDAIYNIIDTIKKENNL